MRAQRLGESAERDRRNGEVVHQLGGFADARTRLRDDVEQISRIVGVESVTGEQQTLLELLPRTPIKTWPELVQRLAHTATEVLVRDVAPTVADQYPILGQETFDGQRGERRQHHPLREVAGCAEKHEHGR